MKHYALTNYKEFFAETPEAYFGVNDFFPFNRAGLKEAEPEISELMVRTGEEPSTKPLQDHQADHDTPPERCSAVAVAPG